MTTRWTSTDSARWRARIRAAWPGDCWRCGRPLEITDPWDVGHIEDRVDGSTNTAENIGGPECYPCNRGSGGRRGNAIQAAARAARTRMPTGWGV